MFARIGETTAPCGVPRLLRVPWFPSVMSTFSHFEIRRRMRLSWIRCRRKTGGRRKGTPNKTTAELRGAAQQYTLAALEGPAQIARTSESDAAKVAAWKAILDRGHGRPAQAIQVGADPDSVPVVFSMNFGDGLKQD